MKKKNRLSILIIAIKGIATLQAALILILLSFNFETILAQNGWVKTFGEEYYDVGVGSFQTPDGGFITSGNTNGFDCAKPSTYIIKTDALGNQIWYKTIQIDSFSTYINCINITSDGGYIIAGSITGFSGNSDFFMLKTDENGNKIWHKSFDCKLIDCIYSITQISGGGYVFAGYAYDTTNYNTDLFYLKTDMFGNEIWRKTYNNNSVTTYAYSIKTAFDGGYIIVGKTVLNNINNGLVIKTDSDGNVIWEKTYNSFEFGDGLTDLTKSTDGGYIVCGYNGPGCGQEGAYDIRIRKIDSNGNEIWAILSHQLQSTVSNFVLHSISRTNDNNYVAVGVAYNENMNLNSDVYFIKFNESGEILFDTIMDFYECDFIKNINLCDDGGFILTGYSSNNPPYYDVLLIKTNSNGMLNVEGNNNSNFDFVNVFPNPATEGNIKISVENNEFLQLNINIFDFTGKTIINPHCSLIR